MRVLGFILLTLPALTTGCASPGLGTLPGIGQLTGSGATARRHVLDLQPGPLAEPRFDQAAVAPALPPAGPIEPAEPRHGILNGRTGVSESPETAAIVVGRGPEQARVPDGVSELVEIDAPSPEPNAEPTPADPVAPVVPAPVRLPEPELLSAQALLGSPVRLPDGSVAGRLKDLLITSGADGGQITGVILDPAPGAEGVAKFVEVSAIDWASDGDGLWLNLAPSALAKVDLRDLISGEGIQTIEGLITEFDLDASSPEGALVLKVRDDKNILHRVHVAAPSLVQEQLPGSIQDKKAKVEGVLTRDERGKVVVATALELDDTRVQVRGPEGDIDWVGIATHLMRGRELLQSSVFGNTAEVSRWLVNRETKRIESIWVVEDGRERELTWGEMIAGKDRP